MLLRYTSAVNLIGKLCLLEMYLLLFKYYLISDSVYLKVFSFTLENSIINFNKNIIASLLCSM